MRGKIQRSRQGCETCKQRKKKCDEVKPRCSTCTRLGSACLYVKKLNWCKANQTLTTHYTVECRPFKHLLVTTMDDVDISLQILDPDTTKTKKHQPFTRDESLPPRKDEINFKFDNKLENKLFDYYVEVVSRKKVFSDTQLNEFRSIVIPHCITSPSLFQSIIALSASDLIRKYPSQGSYFQSLTKKYKNEAISLMYDLLDEFGKDSINEIVISLLIICSLEIGDNVNDHWIIYLKQSCLIFQTLDDETIVNTPGLLFCYRYFTLRYILLLTTLNKVEYSDFIEKFPVKLIEGFFDSEKVDYMFGCSPKLLKIIYEITSLKNHGSTDLENQIAHIYDELFSLDTRSHKPDKSTETDAKLEACATLYLQTTKLYLESSFNAVLNKLHYSFEVDKLIDRIIKTYKSLQDSQNPTLFPMWTIVIVSTCKIGDHARVDILEILENMEKIWPKSSVSFSKQAIESIWRVTDLFPGIDWRDLISFREFKLALT